MLSGALARTGVVEDKDKERRGVVGVRVVTMRVLVRVRVRILHRNMAGGDENVGMRRGIGKMYDMAVGEA